MAAKVPNFSALPSTAELVGGQILFHSIDGLSFDFAICAFLPMDDNGDRIGRFSEFVRFRRERPKANLGNFQNPNSHFFPKLCL